MRLKSKTTTSENATQTTWRRYVLSALGAITLLVGSLAAFPTPAYASTSTTSSTPVGTLFVSSSTSANITAPIGGSGSGTLPAALWGISTGTSDGWQGSLAASNFIYTGQWTPIGSAPPLGSSSSAGYTGSANGNTYTASVTSVSGSDIGFSYSSQNGATGTSTATAGTAANVGTNGLTITFSSSVTYSAGDEYQIHVGSQNANALTLADSTSAASIVPDQSPTSAAPNFVNPTASISGGGANYGPAVTILSAPSYSGMDEYEVTPAATVTVGTNSWAATYTSQLQYTISSGPTATNFFPWGTFPTGLWESSPGNCNDYDIAQAVLTANIKQDAYDGYPAMVLSGSYGNACETHVISMPSTLSAGDTFLVQLAAQTQGPLSAGPSFCIWDTQQATCLPESWSPAQVGVSNWTNFTVTVTLPSDYVYGDTLTLFLYSGNTAAGGPPAINAYADVTMTASNP